MLNLPYDKEDLLLSPDELDAKYNWEGDGEHPKYLRKHWRNAVDHEETISGYWQWVQRQIYLDDEEHIIQ